MGLLVTLAIVVLIFLVGALMYLRLDEQGFWDDFPDNLKAKIADMRGESGSEEASFEPEDDVDNTGDSGVEAGDSGVEVAEIREDGSDRPAESSDEAGAIDDVVSTSEGENESAGEAAPAAQLDSESGVEGEPSADDQATDSRAKKNVENRDEQGYPSVDESAGDDGGDEAETLAGGDEADSNAEASEPQDTVASAAAQGFGVIKRNSRSGDEEAAAAEMAAESESPEEGGPLGLEIGRRDEVKD